MINKFHFLKGIVLTTLVSCAVISCTTQPTESRYVVLSNGELPVFLDTKTNEVYVVQPFHDGKPIIYKKSLSDTEK